MIKYCRKVREIEDSIWSVFTSFGYIETEKNEVSTNEESGKFCYFSDGKCVCVKSGNVNAKDLAEGVALCVETSIANGLDDFTVEVGNKEVFELLVLFGFEKIVKFNDKIEGFSATSNGISYSYSQNSEKRAESVIETAKFIEALEKHGIDMSDFGIDGSLVFSEIGAEGLSYDVCYNLRVNGCIVEYYSEDNDIENACKYAEDKGLSCVVRVYADGFLQIKDFAKNEIIETTVAEFLGYYEEEEECDCGCDHDHHDHDCSCGHHHGEDHECSCGHSHDEEHECKCGHDHHGDCSCGHHHE